MRSGTMGRAAGDGTGAGGVLAAVVGRRSLAKPNPPRRHRATEKPFWYFDFLCASGESWSVSKGETARGRPGPGCEVNSQTPGDSSGPGSDGPADLFIGQSSRLLEYVEKHGFGQLPGLRVLIRGVVGGEQDLAIGQRIFRAVPEYVSGFAGQPAAAHKVQVSIEADLPQSDHHFNRRRPLDLAIEKGRAVGKFEGKACCRAARAAAVM